MTDGVGSGWLDWLKKLLTGKSEATQQSHGDQGVNIGHVSGGVVNIDNSKTLAHVTQLGPEVVEAGTSQQGGTLTQVKRTFIQKTLLEITDDVASVPPLQQDDKAKHYIGLWVRWELELAKLSARGEEYSRSGPKTHAALLFVENGPGNFERRYASALVKQTDVPGLSFRDRGDLMRIVGRIKSAGDDEVHLEEVELEFIERPPELPEVEASPALVEGPQTTALPPGDDT